MQNIALLGAGGKMGGRTIDHLHGRAEYRLQCVEVSPAGVARLRARGLEPVPRDAALAAADAVILALPDRVLGAVAREITPQVRPGTLMFLLDPAAAHAGELPDRPDVAWFIAHPCHPGVFDHFETPAERDDFFGGVHAAQAIVCALRQGPEEDYVRGEALARAIYAPVARSHRITVEQMAILEPTMAETCGIALVLALREVLEEAVRRGVPRAAAEDFMYGHLKVELGIGFGRAQFPFSDGARLIAAYGAPRLLRPDWRTLFEPDEVKAQARAIVSGELPPAPGAERKGSGQAAAPATL